jgi:hypothetical protein
VGCKLNIGPVLSTTIRKVFLLISETLLAASVCLIWTFDFEDTGLLNNDGVTSNGVITVSDLEVGSTWKYTTNGSDFQDGSNNSFTLEEGTYAANTIQIKQTDAAGNVSDISKNTLRIVVVSLLCNNVCIVL